MIEVDRNIRIKLIWRRYVLETMTSFALIFISFGVGLDPRQREVFGPALSPILVLAPLLLSLDRRLIHVGRSGSRTLYFCFWNR